MTGLPMTQLVRAATSVRTGLQTLTRRMVPQEVGLLELASGFMATHALYAAAKLRIADALTNGPLTPAEIATWAETDADATHRLLRACATYGVFSEDPDGRFGLSPLAETLRSDAPNSMRPVILMLGAPQYQGPWGQLTSAVQGGQAAAKAPLGSTFWEYLDDDPEFAGIFDDAMTRLTALDWPTIEAAYDFSPFATIVDVGGGRGQLLALILQSHQSTRGVLLERASVASKAEELLSAAGVLDRCRIDVGSFFETAPSDGDLYVLRRVIHDFDDDSAITILANLRRHMPAESTLLLMESIVPPGNAPHLAKTLDLDMMIFGGRERTEPQYRSLLDQAGFMVRRIIPTISTISIIEAAWGELR